jgi:hypothetical protein
MGLPAFLRAVRARVVATRAVGAVVGARVAAATAAGVMAGVTVEAATAAVHKARAPVWGQAGWE